VSIHRFVVLADRVRGFDTREEAERYARANFPSVLCERRTQEDGSDQLVELVRHDFMYDPERGAWSIFLG
jgi:hypothetical protein